jgi:hypothetical protein
MHIFKAFGVILLHFEMDFKNASSMSSGRSFKKINFLSAVFFRQCRSATVGARHGRPAWAHPCSVIL